MITRKCYVIMSGKFYTDGSIALITADKKVAKKWLKLDGFKKCFDSDLYEKYNGIYWLFAKIEEHDLVDYSMFVE